MKWMIASDIHGSAFYCRKLLERFEKEEAEGLLLLGDILYHGPRNDLPEEYSPKKVIAMLNPLKDKIVCVRGNCDAEVDQMVLEFPIMDEKKELLFDRIPVVAVHGHHLEDLPVQELVEGTVVVSGHTHIPCIKEEEGIVFLNPGSVSIPKEGSAHGYIIFDNGIFRFMDLEGAEYMKFTQKIQFVK